MRYIIRSSPNPLVLTQPRIGKYDLCNLDGSELLSIPDQDCVIPHKQGGFGVVVRATDALGLPRAVKVLKPDITSTAARGDFVNEVQLAGSQPFQHVLPLLDYGSDKDARQTEFGYYVMQWIDGLGLTDLTRHLLAQYGQSVHTVVSVRQHVRDLLLRIIDHILLGLQELADARVMHMDISTNNIMVHVPDFHKAHSVSRLATTARAFLIDLGAAKSLAEEPDAWTTFIHNPLFASRPLIAEVARGAQSTSSGEATLVQYGTIYKYTGYIDAYCFARTLESILFACRDRNPEAARHLWPSAEEDRQKEEFWSVVLGDDLESLNARIKQVLQSKPEPLAISTLVELFSGLTLSSAQAIHESVLLSDRYSHRRLRVGPALIQVGPPLDKVIDHPVFQRLRRLKQLGFLDEVFPGATHSRFSHSLLTFDLAKRYVTSLSSRTDFLCLRRDVDTILAAALLHDVGQYPLAHAIEDLRKAGDLLDVEHLKQVKHDQELVMPKLNAQVDGYLTIADTLTGYGIDPRDIGLLTSKRLNVAGVDGRMPEPIRTIARDMISGVIDADRVAYLLYDAAQTGVNYGRAVDIESLLMGLTIRLDGAVGLALEESAVSAAEGILSAVQWMYNNVYWHHSNRGFMAAVKFIMERLLRPSPTARLTFDDYLGATALGGELEAVRFLEAQFTHYWPESHNPLTSLLQLRRFGYKRICTIGPRDEPEVHQALLGRARPKDVDDIIALLSQRFGAWRPRDGEMLLDIPLKPRVGVGPVTVAEAGARAMDRLFVRLRWPSSRAHRDWMSILDYSQLAASFDAAKDEGMKVRLFVARSLLDRIGKNRIRTFEKSAYDGLREAVGFPR